MKLICKENSEEITSFSVVIVDVRDFKVTPNDYKIIISECDREYYNSRLLRIIYSTKSSGEMIWTSSEDTVEKYSNWMDNLQNENKEFEILNEMVENFKEFGPFLIEV